MLPNTISNSVLGNYRGHSYAILNNISHDGYEMSPLTSRVNEITNNPEIKMHHAVSIYANDNREKPARSGLLKRLLTGAAIVTATGMLATGCYYGYIATNRARPSVQPEQQYPPSSLAVSERPQYSSTGSPMAIPEENTMTQPLPETSRSPYSYYEKKHAATAIKNNVLLSATVTNPLTVTAPTEYASTVIFEKTDSDILPHQYYHDDERYIYYDTLPVDEYYPLGERLYLSLVDFCHSRIEYAVIQSVTAGPVMKCKFLGFIYSMIEDYDYADNYLRASNAEKERLTPEEHAEEILTRRKLTTLLLAGEYIIDKKESADFYSNAMRDNNDYSSEQIAKRKAYIKEYYTKQNNRC